MKYLLQFGLVAVLIASFAASETAFAVTNPCTTTNPCNYQVCGDHICSQGEFAKYMTTVFNAQRGNATTSGNATGGNAATTVSASTLYLGTMSYEDVASDGTLVIVSTTHPMEAKPLVLGIGFFTANGSPIPNQNYAITITQKNSAVFTDLKGHTSTGINTIVTSAMPSSNEPLNLVVTLNGVGQANADPSTWTGVKGEMLNFAQGPLPEISTMSRNMTTTSISVTPSPEFGQLAPIALTIAILSVIIFAKARLPKP